MHSTDMAQPKLYRRHHLSEKRNKRHSVEDASKGKEETELEKGEGGRGKEQRGLVGSFKSLI